MLDTVTIEDHRQNFSTANPDIYRYPFPPFPNGWFPVGESHRLAKGQLQSLHMLGQDIVLYRTEQGIANVIGAYCPHLGAHLGYGGTIQGEDIVCPFHKWQYGLDGKCTAACNAKKTPQASVKTYHVREKNGAIFIWHDVKGREPFWEIPDLEETTSDEYRLLKSEVHTINTHPQEAFENQPDSLHLETLHGYKLTKADWDCDDYSTSLELEMTMGESDQIGRVTVRAWGPSYNFSRFKDGIPAVAIFMYTPTHPGSLYNPVAFWVHKSIPDEFANLWADFITEGYVMDFDVWERKRYEQNPCMSDADGPVAKMRQWYQRWYE